ncbi:MAG: 5-bromo-4-chloroindolyl phosphate hydrolysis family protein [Clostridiales bacterium]|nr:5-bromo-4-chloroindolyl phosphate hydrolysis family protein [Clostridiales bacterium]
MNNSESSKIKFVIGVVGMIVFGILLVIFLLVLLVASIFSHGTSLIAPVIVFAVLFIVSTWLMNTGNRHRRVISRLSRYNAELSGSINVVTIEDMTAITGFSPTQIRSDMRMLKQLNLNFDLYTDKDETTLIKGRKVYSMYLETEQQREALVREEAERQKRLQDPATATIETFRSEGAAIMEKLRAANLVLPGEAISKSIYKLERTTKRIFDHIESHPEKLPDTRKLMSYHLPTTMMLIDKYCQYDTLEYQPGNVASAKADIEKALNAANEAFENFLESLYRVDTLDVTTEAEVLTKMFEKDGLTGQKFDVGNDRLPGPDQDQ